MPMRQTLVARQPPPPAPQLAGLEENTMSGSQEAVPVPMIAGTRKLACKWASRVYNQRAAEAPPTTTGKK